MSEIARDIRGDQFAGASVGTTRPETHLTLNGIAPVIAAMPGVGKSTLMRKAAEAGCKITDSDSQRFNFLTNDKGEYVDRDGSLVTTKEARVPNPNFVADYVAHIKEALTRNDLVFVSAHEVVRDALAAGGIKFDLVRYDDDIKDEIVARIRNRQSNQPNAIIANVVDSNWNTWMKTINKAGPEHIFVLKAGQFLDDILHLDVSSLSLNPQERVMIAARELAVKARKG